MQCKAKVKKQNQTELNLKLRPNLSQENVTQRRQQQKNQI